MEIYEINSILGTSLADEIKYHFMGNITDLTPDEMRFFYRFLYESADGFCDHSVNICACGIKRVLQGMAEKVGVKPGEYDYSFPKPDDFDKLLGLSEAVRAERMACARMICPLCFSLVKPPEYNPNNNTWSHTDVSGWYWGNCLAAAFHEKSRIADTNTEAFRKQLTDAK